MDINDIKWWVDYYEHRGRRAPFEWRFQWWYVNSVFYKGYKSSRHKVANAAQVTLTRIEETRELRQQIYGSALHSKLMLNATRVELLAVYDADVKEYALAVDRLIANALHVRRALAKKKS